MRSLNNITRGLNRLGSNAGKPAGLPAALRAKFLFIWTGKYDGDNLKDDLGGAAVITVTDKDWTTSFIPPTTAATFAVPDNATFLAADGADDFWFNASNALLQKTHANLIASTTARTFIKYADTSPHNVYGIGILKDGETLTDGEKIKLNRYFRLWAEYWGELMDSGYLKSNRIVEEDWSSYWATRLPYFALPATGVSLMVGQEVTIYGDALINQPIGGDLTVTYTCDIGAASGNNYTITPVAGDIGNHSLRVVFVSNGVTREDQIIKLSVYAAVPDLNKKALMMGDSVVDTMSSVIIYGIADTLTQTITWVGTQTCTNSAPYGVTLNEGYTGASFHSYATEDVTEFHKAGVFDVAAYFTDNSIDVPDFVCLRLGINDAYAYCDNQVTLTGFSELNLSGIVDDAKTMIDAFLAHNADLHFIIELPTICENSGAGWAAKYDETRYIQDVYISNIHRLWIEIVETFANGVYDERVDVSYGAIFVDRDGGYPKTDGVHADSVHPSVSGCLQLGTGLAMTLNKLYIEKLLRDTNTEGSWDFLDLDNLTKSEAELIGTCADQLGSAHQLNQATDGSKPTWSASEGATFVDDLMVAVFELNQPTFIYAVIKPLSWTASRAFWDGGAGVNRGILSQNTSTPNVYAYAGAGSALSPDLTLNEWHIVRVLYNGADSLLQIDDHDPITGNFGTANMGGIWLGSLNLLGYNAHFSIKRLIARKSADATAAHLALFAGLKCKYDVTF